MVISPCDSRQAPPEGYRLCAGAAVFNRTGKVFAGRRVGMPAEAPFAWQLPQGGLDAGETPEQGARRELLEETGICSVKLIAEIDQWLTYDFPAEILGKKFKKYKGQTQRWFAYEFTGADTEIDLNADGTPEFQQWDWVSLNSIPSLIVPFKRTVYEAIVSAFKPVADERASNGDQGN